MGKMEKFLSNEQERQNLVADRNVYIFLALSVALSLFINLFLIAGQPTIQSDGVDYIKAGIGFVSGEGFSGIWPPFYPLLIGLVNLLINDSEFSARLVSCIFGALTLLPLFFISRLAFGRKIAVITCILAVIYPILCEYSPAALSESTYLFLFLCGLLVSWKALQDQNILYFFLSGIVWAMAYLTRPEGLGYFAFFILILIVKFIKNINTKYIIYACIFVIGFMGTSFPYLYHIKAKTGNWSFSEKSGLNFVLGEKVGGKEDWGTAYESAYFSLSKDGKQLAAEIILEKKESSLSYLIANPKELIRRYLINLHLMNKYVIPGVLNPFVLMLFSIGLVSGNIEETKKASVMFLAFIPYIALPLFIVAPRYFIPFVPIILIWSARGIEELSKWVFKISGGGNGRLSRMIKNRKRIEIILTTIVILSFIPFTFRPFLRKEIAPSIYKEIGIWLKSELPKNAMLMVRKPWIPFYAEMDHVVIPFASWGETLSYAKYKKAEYFIADESIIGTRKDLKFLFDRNAEPAALDKIKEYRKNSGEKIFIYRIKNK